MSGRIKRKGWLQEAEQCDICEAGADYSRDCLVAKAYTGFENLASVEEQQAYLNFCTDKASWLDDYALFVALHNERSQLCWNQWPEPLKERKAAALNAARKRMVSEIEMIKFEQFLFIGSGWHLKNMPIAKMSYYLAISLFCFL